MDVAALSKCMKEKKGAKAISRLWTKCPKCYEILYPREVEKLNKCPWCGHVYPYPFAKAQEIRGLLCKKGTTFGEIGEFVLKALDSIKSKKEKVAFLCKFHSLILEDFEWKQMRKKGEVS